MRLPVVSHCGDVEARETHGTGRDEDEAHEHAGGPELLERPVVHEDRRRDAKRDHVGERVELNANRALCLGQAGDSPVDPIEEKGKDDEKRRAIEVIAGGVI